MPVPVVRLNHDVKRNSDFVKTHNIPATRAGAAGRMASFRDMKDASHHEGPQPV